MRRFTSAGLPLVLALNGGGAELHGSVLTNSVDLRPRFESWGLKPRVQGSRGTCSVFTLTGGIEFAVAARQGRGDRFSVEYLNWAANQVAGRPKDGGFFSELWNGFAKYGICPETQMPYRGKFDPAQPPSAEAVEAAAGTLKVGLRLHWLKQWNVKTGLSESEFSAIKQTLRDGWPVCAGFRWPKHEVWQENVLQMSAAEDVFDGHSVLLVGYRDDETQPGGGLFIFRNSSHNGRDGFMPFAYARTNMNDAVWIDVPMVHP